MRMKKIFQFTIVVIPLILTVVFLILFLRANNALEQLKNEYDNSNENYKKEIDTLKIQNRELSRVSKSNLPNNISLYTYDIERLKAKGLYDPVKEIISDLTDKPELIPYKGVLGGTMRFYQSETWVLNNKWVYTYFEDGHIGGYMLLEYDVSGNGEITWTRIADMMN